MYDPTRIMPVKGQVFTHKQVTNDELYKLRENISFNPEIYWDEEFGEMPTGCVGYDALKSEMYFMGKKSDKKYVGHGHKRAIIRIEKDDGNIRKFKTSPCFRTESWYEGGETEWKHITNEKSNPDETFAKMWERLGEDLIEKVNRGVFRYDQIRGLEI